MAKLYQPIQLDDVDVGDEIVWNLPGEVGDVVGEAWWRVVKFDGPYVYVHRRRRKDRENSQAARFLTRHMHGIIRRGFKAGVEWEWSE